MGTKILAVSDIHIGRDFLEEGKSGSEQTNKRFTKFGGKTERAFYSKVSEVDYLVLDGDTFSVDASIEEPLKFTRNLIERFPQVSIHFIFGNHDGAPRKSFKKEANKKNRKTHRKFREALEEYTIIYPNFHCSDSLQIAGNLFFIHGHMEETEGLESQKLYDGDLTEILRSRRYEEFLYRAESTASENNGRWQGWLFRGHTHKPVESSVKIGDTEVAHINLGTLGAEFSPTKPQRANFKLITLSDTGSVKKIEDVVLDEHYVR